jgi:hypothetical protein
MTSKSKPLQAWDLVEDALSISSNLEEHGHMVITFNEIKRHVDGFEIRKMNKQDLRRQVPDFLRGGGVMSLSGSSLLVYSEDLHIDLPEPSRSTNIDVDMCPPLTNPWHITNEQQAIGVCEAFGLFDRFYGEALDSKPTGRQRLHSPVKMRLNGCSQGSVMITDPMIESDAIGVGPSVAITVEAKRDVHEVHSKQLFLPMHDTVSRLREQGHGHAVKPTVMCFRGKGSFDLYELEFSDPTDITSHAIVRSCRFTLLNKITREAKYTGEVSPNYDDPFPQANDLAVLDGLYTILRDGGGMAEWVSETDYDPRQFAYYLAALRWLRLAEGKPNSPIARTDWMDEGVSMTAHIEGVLRNDKVFSSCIGLEAGVIIDEAASKLQEAHGMTEVTARRRASTVKAWLTGLGLVDG